MVDSVDRSNKNSNGSESRIVGASRTDAGDGRKVPQVGSARDAFINDALTIYKSDTPRQAFDALTGSTAAALKGAANLLALGDTLPAKVGDKPGNKSGDKTEDDRWVEAFKGAGIVATINGNHITFEVDKPNGVTIETGKGGDLWFPGKTNPSYFGKDTKVSAKISESTDAQGNHILELSSVTGLMGREDGGTAFGYVNKAIFTHVPDRQDPKKDGTYTLKTLGTRGLWSKEVESAIEPDKGKLMFGYISRLKAEKILTKSKDD